MGVTPAFPREIAMFTTRLRCFDAAALVIGVLGLAIGGALGETTDDPWPDLARDAFNGRALRDGTGLLAIEMPYRAEDAAIVPVIVRSTLPPGDGRSVKAFTIVIDQNPAPVAATFTLGRNAGASTPIPTFMRSPS
jgi:sulfur-oxidizing protein SoxY